MRLVSDTHPTPLLTRSNPYVLRHGLHGSAVAVMYTHMFLCILQPRALV